MTADESTTDDESALADALWTDLLEDTRDLAEEYREDGWDAIVLEPTDIAPVDSEERVGLDVTVSADEYDVVAGLIDDGDVTITAADVYYRPLAAEETDQRVALAVERDDASETAIFVPLAYDITAVRPAFETALLEEQLLVHVLAAPDDGWVSFSHDDPSLFLEKSDVRAWDAE
ncbi:hypothetical protein [Natrinema sp. HArc-T2]|uniref:DUF7529 family protein n=1 Tax=Natrinema sp. HArc-T2 TaxID=3242701 RepID=UPI00359E6237